MALSKEWGRTKVKVRMECNFELFVASKEILEITMNIEIILSLILFIGYNYKTYRLHSLITVYYKL